MRIKRRVVYKILMAVVVGLIITPLLIGGTLYAAPPKGKGHSSAGDSIKDKGDAARLNPYMTPEREKEIRDTMAPFRYEPPFPPSKGTPAKTPAYAAILSTCTLVSSGQHQGVCMYYCLTAKDAASVSAQFTVTRKPFTATDRWDPTGNIYECLDLRRGYHQCSSEDKRKVPCVYRNNRDR